MTTQPDPKNPPVGDGTPPVGEATEENGTPAGPPGVNANGTLDEDQGESKLYDEAYVKNLRDEAAGHRVKATRAADAETRLHELAIAHAVSGILTSSDDLAWSDDYANENGWPDHDKILAAAEDLIVRKPYLGRPRGDVGQGQRGDVVQSVSLSGLLRAGA